MRECSLDAFVLVLALTLSTTGCGSDGSTGPGPGGTDLGSFEVSYDGDASGTISGPAFFGGNEFESGDRTIVSFSVFGVEIENEENGFGLTRLGRQPGPGTYDIHDARTDDPPEGSIRLFIEDDTNSLSVQSTDGTLTIDRSDADRVIGSFDATLIGVRGGTEVTVSATGTFEAVPCEDNVENCPPDTSVPSGRRQAGVP